MQRKVQKKGNSSTGAINSSVKSQHRKGQSEEQMSIEEYDEANQSGSIQDNDLNYQNSNPENLDMNHSHVSIKIEEEQQKQKHQVQRELDLQQIANENQKQEEGSARQPKCQKLRISSSHPQNIGPTKSSEKISMTNRNPNFKSDTKMNFNSSSKHNISGGVSGQDLFDSPEKQNLKKTVEMMIFNKALIIEQAYHLNFIRENSILNAKEEEGKFVQQIDKEILNSLKGKSEQYIQSHLMVWQELRVAIQKMERVQRQSQSQTDKGVKSQLPKSSNVIETEISISKKIEEQM